MKSCEGSCETHIGEVIRVVVFDNYSHREWEFDYCEEAIKEDERRGFLVEKAEKCTCQNIGEAENCDKKCDKKKYEDSI